MNKRACPASSHRRLVRPTVAIAVVAAVASCAPDPPDSIAGARRVFEPITVDAKAEARAHNDKALYEFVADEHGYVSVPRALPAGEVIITLTYTGDMPSPHSLILEGLNGNQPVVAVDLPGSNNGTAVVPPGRLVYYDGAPGNRSLGYEGEIEVSGVGRIPSTTETAATLAWETEGLAFTSMPEGPIEGDVPVALELTVVDALPHSVAFDQVRGDHPLVAVDGPGTNRRTIVLPPGTYIYYCAVPGHREAGMEGLVTID